MTAPTDRVIHVRIADKTIAGCYKMLEQSGRKMNNLPMSSIIRYAIEGVVDFMVAKGDIPETPEPQAFIDNIWTTSGGEDLDISQSHPFDGLFNHLEKQEKEDNVLARVAELATKHIEEASKPEIGGKVKLQEVDADQVLPSMLNLLKVVRSDINVLAKVSPKDMYIEWAQKDERLDYERAAVEIAYTNLESNLWGTDVATKQIRELIAMHKPENNE